ncbi:MAG: phage tail tape measure protein, partial [Pseudomonadota bacterium]|nr:phage tail tape measure protein [Pseudomonadota bacterium]
MAIDAESLAKTGEYARRAGTAAGQAQKSIIASYRGTSPYLTSQPRAPGGVRGRPLDPTLAEAAGVTVDPRILQAQIAEYANLRGELKPLLDMLTGIDLEGLTGPLKKARVLFAELTGTVEQAGAKWQEAFDLSTFTQDLTTLRGALEEFLFRNINASEVQRQNLKDTLFFLKDLEKQYARLGNEVVKGGILKVPKWLQPDVQRQLHKRNLENLRKGFAETVSDKGPQALERVGQRLNYTWKVFNEGGTVIDNFVFKFRKLGDAFTSEGQAIGRFTESVDDMNKAFQSRQGVSSAFRRVIMWGGAAAIVYGTVEALRDMVDTISGVETAMVQLRKVMNPVVTDFEEIQRAGVEMAKNFGVPIQNVIESMRVFAQQGLRQAEVLERARTSTLAANVTVLSAQDATEALTSATKQFSDAGEDSITFLDSWIEVAARHAITSKDLALAMQRAGSAAKNAGIDFNQLNAIVTGIGVTTRQTGREIGTSIRFMARRLTAAKAPAELAKVGIQAFLPTGEVRRAFDIFDELAMKWDDLTQAQRLNISMAVGGRRHYNSVLVLMKNWDETLEALTHSQNSQGSALRRNIIVMETFNKKVEQLRQSIIETQLAFGKFALPVAKGLIDSIRFIAERMAEVPDSIKIATLSLGGLLVLANKGAGVIDRMADAWSTLTGFGKIGVMGGAQKGITSLGTAVKGITAAKSIYDVNSALGKLAFILVDVGRSYNAFIGDAAGSLAIFNILKVATVTLASAFTGIAGPFAAFSKVSSAITIPALTGLSLIMKSLSKTGTGLIGSLGPLAVTLLGLYNVTKPLIKGFMDANKTAKQFAEERQNEIFEIFVACIALYHDDSSFHYMFYNRSNS